MDFSLSEEQILLQESLTKFIQKDYTFEQRTKLLETEEGFSKKHWQFFAEQGWLGMLFSEEDGGFGGNPTDLMVMMEVFGKALVVEPFVPTIVLAGGLISQCGSAEQKARYLPYIIEGKTQGALAYAEPQSRFNLNDVVTTANKVDSGDWYLSGYKIVVLNGPAADFFIVSARTDSHQRSKDGISLFLIDKNAEGLEIRDYPTVDGGRASEVVMKEVKVDATALLGEEGKGAQALEHAIDKGTLAVGAEAVGCMEVAYKNTVEYCRTRVQFGQPIGKFQVLQHRMVDMFMEHEQAKSLMYMAAMRLEEGYNDLARSAVSAFKVQVGKSARFVGQSAVQLHGGMGMTEELNIGHYFKRLTTVEPLFGNSSYHLNRFATLQASEAA